MEIKVKNKTQERYVIELKRFLKTGKDIFDYIEKNVKDKKELSKLHCGLKLIDFEDKREILRKVKNMFDKKPKYIKEPEPQLKVRNLENSINRMKNKRLKLAFRLQEIGGLRVQELSNLTIDDISINKDTDRIIISVKNGKGGKDRTVKCLYDKWVLDNLIQLEPRKNEKLFYSSGYMATQARKICNFHTHDLRKVFAHNKFHNNTAHNAVEELQQDLGHNENTRTYLKYLGRDINTVNTRWDKLEPLEGERTDLK